MTTIPNHFLVFVPGFMGSKLRDRATGEIVWIDLKSIPLLPTQWKRWLENLFAKLTYPNKNLEPAGILDEVLFIPPWGKFEQYGRLVDVITEMGYEVNPEHPSKNKPSMYTFAYDWRQDNRISAAQLGEAINRWRVNHPDAKVWIIAHSNGGLVSRWYIEKLGGKEYVDRLFLIASPWDGAPNALRVLFNGLDTLFRKRFNQALNIPEVTRKAARTFPCTYQLLPYKNPFLQDFNNNPVNIFDGSDWLDDAAQQKLLEDGKRFNEELGKTASAGETLCYFGRKKSTNARGTLITAAAGRWSEILWQATESGDGTLPERSAIHPNASSKIPFIAGHGDIYVVPALVEVLEWELTGKFQEPERAALTTERLTIIFEPEKDVYSPGERINLWATIQSNKDTSAISDASIQLQTEWIEPLPATKIVESPKRIPIVLLEESDKAVGRYEGSLDAPQTEGYYRLKTVVNVQGEPSLLLEEIIAIESLPEQVGAASHGQEISLERHTSP